MNDEKDKEKKGGFGAAPVFNGTPNIVGGASSGLGSGAGSFFAGKAGLVALALGSATIAAGVGVVYNFIGPSAKPAYSPELFQNSYYEEEAAKAGAERPTQQNAAAAEPSTLDLFKQQAQKDGLAVDEAEKAAAAAAASPDAAVDAPAGAPAADGGAAGASGAGLAGDGGQKLKAAAGFGSKGGGAGGGSAMPRMQGGGLSGGIGSQFDSIYKPPVQANAGKTSGMTASAARVKSSPKYAVPNFNKKGAFGQAKYAGKMGVKAVGTSGAASSAYATEAMGGGEAGSGDVGSNATGAGIGGAGVADGSKLKGSDPSLSSNESTPPKVPEPENVSPWQKTLNMIMYAMLAAAALIMIANMMAKSTWGAPYAQYVAMAAMLAAALVIVGAITMMSKYGQKWTGMMYTVVGGALLYMANKARVGAAEPAAEQVATKAGTDSSWMTMISNYLKPPSSEAPKKKE
jgi:hypothetical protein